MSNETPTGQEDQPSWDTYSAPVEPEHQGGQTQGAPTSPPAADQEIGWWPPQQAGPWQSQPAGPWQSQQAGPWQSEPAGPWQPQQAGPWQQPMGPPPAYPMPRRKKSPWLFVGIGAACLVAIAVAVPLLLHRPPTSTSDRALAAGNSASTPSGYQSFADQTYHFTIAVPSSWHEIDPGSPGASAALNDAEQMNPNLKAVLPDVSSLAAEGMKFMAIAPTPIDGFSPNMNIIAHAAVGYTDSDLGDVAGQVSTEYAKLGATITGTQMTTVAGHKALEESADLPVHTASGDSITVHEVQYFLGSNDIAYIISLSDASPEMSTIVSSFRIH